MLYDLKNLNQLYFMQQDTGIKLYLSDKVTLCSYNLTMKQCLDVFYLNRRNTTILEEKIYTISRFPS